MPESRVFAQVQKQTRRTFSEAGVLFLICTVGFLSGLSTFSSDAISDCLHAPLLLAREVPSNSTQNWALLVWRPGDISSSLRSKRFRRFYRTFRFQAFFSLWPRENWGEGEKCKEWKGVLRKG